jgi:hypothetical protein
MKINTYHSTNAPKDRCWIAHLYTPRKSGNKSEPNASNDPWGWIPLTFFGDTEEAAAEKAMTTWRENEAARREKIENRRIGAEKRKKKVPDHDQ